MIKKCDLSHRINKSTTLEVEWKPLLLFLLGFVLFLSIALVGQAIFKDSYFGRVSCLVFGLIVLFTTFKKVDRITKKIVKQKALHCPKCKSQFIVSDLKLVMVSDKCPYCAEIITDKTKM